MKSQQSAVAGVTEDHVDTFDRDGVVCIRGLISPEWLDHLRVAVEEVMTNPGPHVRDMAQGDGRFFTDIFMWQHNEKIRTFLADSPVGAAAAALMRSKETRLYNDHLLVKEPGTDAPTPWHQDLPYFRVDGFQIGSFWIGLDPVTKESGAMSFVKGSHKWKKMYQPKSFTGVSDLDADLFDGKVPDVEAHPEMETVCYEMQPGDCTFHHVLTLHCAGGNATQDTRRRALSVRIAGDDAVWLKRRFSPSGIDTGLADGAPLRGEMFWQLHPAA